MSFERIDYQEPAPAEKIAPEIVSDKADLVEAADLKEELGLDVVGLRERAKNPMQRELLTRSGKNLAATVDSFFTTFSREGWLNDQALDTKTETEMAAVCQPIVDILRGGEKLDKAQQEASELTEYGEILNTNTRLEKLMKAKTAELYSRQGHIESGTEELPRFTTENALATAVQYATRISSGDITDKVLWGLKGSLGALERGVREAVLPSCRDRQDPEKLSGMVKKELDKVRKTAFIGINVNADTMLQCIETGGFLALSELPTAQRDQHAAEMNAYSREHYIQHRAANEQILQHDFQLSPAQQKRAIIYGTLGSDFGSEKAAGGEPRYGEINVVLKPEISRRATFSEGDSLNPGASHTIEWGRTFDADEKYRQPVNRPSMGKLKSATLTSPKSTMARTLCYEDALASKAILDVEKDILAGYGQTTGHNDYIEAHIFGGVNLDDIAEIRIPKSVEELVNQPVEPADNSEARQQYTALLERIKARPEIASKIRFV